MRRLLLVLLLLPFPALAQWGNIVPKTHYGPPPPVGCLQGSAYLDGCPGAPVGSPFQLPTVLNSYVVRPPWNVAGVDYYVGYPTSTTLQDPATISISGVTVNAGAHTVTVTGSNVVLSGYDFGLANGWTVTVNGANCTITNSRFIVGSNQAPNYVALIVNSGAAGFTLLNNEFNGNNLAPPPQVSAMVEFNGGTGTWMVEYNYFHNSGGDMIDFAGVNIGSLLLRYNLLRDIGLLTGHSDTVQFCTSKFAAGTMEFNTVYQSAAGLSGEGLLTTYSECGGAAVTNVTNRDNTLISKVKDNWATGQSITQDSGAATGDHNSTYDNYVDPTGIDAFTDSPWFATYSNNAGSLGNPAALYNLTNMVTGALIPVPTRTSPQGGYAVYPDNSNYSPCICSPSHRC